MEKKIKFTENPNFVKTVYGVVIAVLCITAIIIGIVAANQRNDGELPEEPPVTDGTGDGTGEGENNGTGSTDGNGGDENKEPEKLTFISPVSGKVVESHSLTQPVYSETLEEWRIHTGIDISTADGAPVFAAAGGTVSKIYNDALLGHTVEITHEGDIKTLYSNLSADDSYVAVGDEVSVGARIGTVGDTSVSELAKESHLHFAVIESGASVDPLGIISDEAKEASLGIKIED
ncbi:MAG: M23 family metallopeptidase [Clostridia bacterium]|nr:M23 family metallopeptidase [Clostridia bacterium]